LLVGESAGHVVQHADFHHSIGSLRQGAIRRPDRGGSEASGGGTALM
jgi:hypothetical protein